MKKNADQWNTAASLLEYLNGTYAALHTKYENYYWLSLMGDHIVNDKKDAALNGRDAFRSNESLKCLVDSFYEKSTGKTKERLGYWQRFFSLYQTPEKAKMLKEKINALETSIERSRADRKQGYVDPATKKFVTSSVNTMRGIIVSSDDEAIRQACFESIGALSLENVDEYVKLVGLRNEFARLLGYTDFYAYKLDIEEGMTKKDLFDIFDAIYDKTKYAFADVRKLEKKQPGLRKPWNYSHRMAGSFMKEEDQYFPFDQSLERWGRTFASMGISYQGSGLVFDLLDRKGKYNNGFCHWPEIIQFEGNKRITGRAQLTCNVVLGMPGQSSLGLDTLFHEGGHAAHLLNSEMRDVCLNHEYPPMSTAWAETQSMFLDRISGSIEWLNRYAKNDAGQAYPLELFERNLKATHIVQPLEMMGIMRVCYFEKDVYETKNLTADKVIAAAKKVSRKYLDFSVDSISVLEVPHIYAWENACGYHAYALAMLGLAQWREYFFKKYGYVVDNPHIGKEMKKVWQFGSAKTFPEFIRLATGKKLSSMPYVQSVTRSIPASIKIAKERISSLSKKPISTKPIDLDAHISLVSGKQVIATNKQSFEKMAAVYAAWLQTQKLT